LRQAKVVVLADAGGKVLVRLAMSPGEMIEAAIHGEKPWNLLAREASE
jgi:hypothetical protein